MQIIINSFLSQIGRIIISTLILSIISISLFNFYKYDRNKSLSEIDDQKKIKIHIMPIKDKDYPQVFNAALDVIFFPVLLRKFQFQNRKGFEEYEFDRNLVLNFDLVDYKSNFNENLSKNVLDVIIENHLNDHNYFNLTHTVINQNEELNLQVLNSVKNYIEPIYKQLILDTLANIVQFKKEFSDPVSSQRNDEIIKKNKKIIGEIKEAAMAGQGVESVAEALTLLTLEESDENVNFVFHKTSEYIDKFIDSGFTYKVTLESITKGRKSFITNISSIIVIILSIIISFIISLVFFVSRKINFN